MSDVCWETSNILMALRNFVHDIIDGGEAPMVEIIPKLRL